MTDEKLREVADKAHGAFWQSVSDSLPEIKTGDLDPYTTIKIEEAMRVAIRKWYEQNKENP